MDCSSGIFEVIICAMCKKYCHKEHEISKPLKKRIKCRCDHKRSKKHTTDCSSSAAESYETSDPFSFSWLQEERNVSTAIKRSM